MVDVGNSKAKRDELVDKMDYMSIEDKKVAYSPDDIRIRNKGDAGQAQRLLEQKRQNAGM